MAFKQEMNTEQLAVMTSIAIGTLNKYTDDNDYLRAANVLIKDSGGDEISNEQYDGVVASLIKGGAIDSSHRFVISNNAKPRNPRDLAKLVRVRSLPTNITLINKPLNKKGIVETIVFNVDGNGSIEYNGEVVKTNLQQISDEVVLKHTDNITSIDNEGRSGFLRWLVVDANNQQLDKWMDANYPINEAQL